jgi:predicted MPP superfamily phosphohydrolase
MVIAAGTYACGIEPSRLTITQHAFGGERGPVLRLVQLSDLHLRAVDRHAERIAEAVHELRPDMLVLTGDAIDRADSAPLLSTFLTLLPDVAHRIAILGNWEHWARLDLTDVRRRYERSGWTLLQNETIRLMHQGIPVQLTGLDDLIGGRPNVAHALADATKMPNHVLLAHCPMHREAFLSAVASSDARDLVPQLMLSGHTHGGQLAVGGWAPMCPPGSGRYVAGWYRDAPTALYVSRGLGTSVVPARFGAPPEIAVFDWRLAT